MADTYLIEDFIRQLSRLQLQVDGLTKPEVGPRWVSWTPTVTQGVNVTLLGTACKYAIVGKLVVIKIAIAISGAGTNGQPIVVTNIPTAVQPADVGRIVGSGLIIDSGTLNHIGVVYTQGTSDIRLIEYQGNFAGQAPTAFALANNDYISYMVCWDIP